MRILYLYPSYESLRAEFWKKLEQSRILVRLFCVLHP